MNASAQRAVQSKSPTPSSPKRNRRKRGRRQRRAREGFGHVVVGPQSTDSVDRCLLDYTKSLADPFDYTLLPCAPVEASRRSWKFTGYSRGTFNCGTSGNGYVAVNPYMMYRGVASGTIFTSVAGGNGLVGDQLDNVAYAAATSPSTSPNTQLIGNAPSVGGIAVRLVSAGLRVKCTSPLLTAQGIVIACNGTDNGSLQDSTMITLDNNPRATRVSAVDCVNNWLEVTWAPQDPSDFSFFTDESAFPSHRGTSYAGQRGPLIVACSGGASAQSFYYEAVAHFEFISQITGGSATPSYYSPLAQTVASTLSEVPPGFWKEVRERSFQALVNAGGAAMVNLARRAFGGRSSGPRMLMQ